MSENLYETSGKLKVLMDYSNGGKPNWYMVINDMDNVDHRAYSNQDLSLYKKKLDAEETILISAKGGTATHKSGKNAGKNFIQKAIISDWLSEDSKEEPVPIYKLEDFLDPSDPNYEEVIKAERTRQKTQLEKENDALPQGKVNHNTQNNAFQNSLKIAEMTLLYKTCMQAVNDDELLGSLEEGNRKDISTTFFLSLQRR